MMIWTRSRLRRFWGRFLDDLKEGRPITDKRWDKADLLVGGWST